MIRRVFILEADSVIHVSSRNKGDGLAKARRYRIQQLREIKASGDGESGLKREMGRPALQYSSKMIGRA